MIWICPDPLPTIPTTTTTVAPAKLRRLLFRSVHDDGDDPTNSSSSSTPDAAAAPTTVLPSPPHQLAAQRPPVSTWRLSLLPPACEGEITDEKESKYKHKKGGKMAADAKVRGECCNSMAIVDSECSFRSPRARRVQSGRRSSSRE